MEEFVDSLLAPEMRTCSTSALAALPPSAFPSCLSTCCAGAAGGRAWRKEPFSFAPAAENINLLAGSSASQVTTMFRSSLGVVVPPQPMHGHLHGHHHAANMQGATASAAFQYQQHQYQYQQPQQQQQQHAMYQSQMHARVNGSAPEDDEVFRQLWYEPEPEESLAALHMRLSGNNSSSSMNVHDHLKQEAYGAEDEEEEEPVIEMPPSSTNSLLFEPLDMPKSNTSTGSFSLEQTLKDAFLNFTPEAAMSPLEKMQASSLSYLRGPSSSGGGSRSNNNSGLYDFFRGQYDQQQHQEYNSTSSNNISSTSSNSSLLNAILGFQTSSWASNNSNMNDTTSTSNNSNNSNNSNSMSGYQQQSNSMRQLLLSTNPPANMNMNLLESSNNPIWISASMLSTPTSQLPAPELGRKISNKKSKARRPAKASGGRRSAVASALVLSLAGITSTANGANDDDSSARRSGMSSPSASSVHSDTDTMSTPESGDKNAKGKKCVEPGCVRRAQSNSRCKAHGGGARCQYTGPGGCVRSSQGGGFCRAHGGGKRCEYPGCLRGQQRKGRCYVHGGIRKCQMGDCEKKDRGNGFCISHGGGKRCEHPGCSRAVRRGLLCQLHEIAS